MGLVKNTNFEEFENSVVSTCFVPTDFDGQSYYVKIHADAPNLPAYRLGSVGDSLGTPELFRLLLPTPLAVGNRGKILLHLTGQKCQIIRKSIHLRQELNMTFSWRI